MSDDHQVSYKTKEDDKLYLSDPKQPELTGRPPRTRKESRMVDGVRYFAPVVPETGKVQILGVGVSPTPEEASGIMESSHGLVHSVKPRLLKGPIGSLIRDTINSFSQLRSDRLAYTTLIPWLLPKNRRFRPKPDEANWAAPALHELIAEIKPEVIVAFGKVAFDQLNNYKISADDARGGWFTYKDTTIPLYLADPVVLLVTQPWSLDVLMTDMREVDRIVGIDRNASEPPLNMREIRTISELEALVSEWEAGNFTRFSVDCEWSGTQYIDGRLRSIQFCWSDVDAAYLNFFDEHNTYHLGETTAPEDLGFEVPVHPNQMVTGGESYIDYQRVGEILGRWLNRPEIRYLGHHFSADSPWMEHWLGLDVLGKCEFDLEFAQQTVNEYSKLGLEVMAMKYTNFGRYDMELVMWKRENRALMAQDEGYGRIPDPILVPYAMLDVLTVWRCYEPLMIEMKYQGLVGYYRNFIIPFVTDVFHTFITTGLPVDLPLFELTRKFFNWAYRALRADFQLMVVEQANEIVAYTLGMPVSVIRVAAGLRDGGKPSKAREMLDAMVPMMTEENEPFWEDTRDHWMEIRSFNIRSSPKMVRWLFRAMRLVPVKTTKNAANGMPSMSWDRVLELPEKLQATLTPAVDKETLEILAESDESGALLRLLAVSNVGNQCKGFLKEGEYDAEGELVEENGLRKFICSDGRIHGNQSLTETSRPRSWKPNILNLSKSHNKGVERGLARILDNELDNPEFVLPEEFDQLFGTPEERKGKKTKDLIKYQMPSIRSTIKAPPGWCFVESDYKTAEIRIQAFSAGDIDLIRLMVGEDDMLAFYQGHSVRLGYRDDSGILPEFRLESLLLSPRDKDGNPILDQHGQPLRILEDELDRNDDGTIKHPSYDLHWSLAEMMRGKPRELLTSKDRDFGKTANFSGAYGAVGTTLERRIEAQTGIKPEPGTGQALLDALLKRQPISVDFLNQLAEKPKHGENLVAASGRIRRFPTHSRDLQGMPWRVRNSYLRAMGNEARNFIPQESVAATANRACQWLNLFFRSNGMQARTIVALYDAIVTLCPLEERHVVSAAHQLFMCDINVWKYHGRWMNYPVDTDFCYRWSWKPTKEEGKDLEDPAFFPMDENRQRFLLDTLRLKKETFFAAQPAILPRLNAI